LLVIVNLSSKGSTFPVEALAQVDSALGAAGLKKQVRSVLVPGKEFSLTYEGPPIEKSRVEEMLSSLAQKNELTFSVEVEESVRFP
jgi:hypothetical protein